ncbi:MAG: mechanosensitive ion channel family protein [Bacteroidetes bacterium]|nr:mechanosensitive ion channel family protein [Bacteroidota bacterium]MDA1333251.1 mechanosensitive ion channel family protein [Bacteroidota bacterium]
MEFLDQQLLGMTVLNWLELAGITVGLTLAMMLVRRLFFGRFSALAGRTKNRVDDIVAEMLHGMRTWFLFVLAFYLAVEFVAVEAPAIPWLRRLLFVGFVFQIGLWGNDIIRLVSEWYVESRDNDASQLTAARAVAMVARLILWAIILLSLLDNFGIDVTALVAGLGIGGIAIALAVQNVLADLLAYVSIVADRPFVDGDFLVVGDHSGSVEHIGIKTTRIRSLSGEQIVFSNNDLLGSRVRNYKRMNERRALFSIGVVYDTPHDVLKAIPAKLQAAVEGAENTRFDRAHLKNFGDFSINFEIVYYMVVPDYAAYMDTQQTINLAVHDVFTREGIEFAFPTQTLHITPGAPTE